MARLPALNPTMGTASGCGTTTASFVLPVETGFHGGVNVCVGGGGGVRRWCRNEGLVWDGVGLCAKVSDSSATLGMTIRYAAEYDSHCNALSWCCASFVNREYPRWGEGGGYALTLSRSFVEGAPSHPCSTMGTASGCGTTGRETVGTGCLLNGTSDCRGCS